MQVDALALAQALIRRPSVTPKDAGALDVLEAVLKQLGFTTHRLPFGDVDNLYARLGDASPHFCFAGHTDVVPPGDGWSADPFAAEIKDGMLYGRGAADMKSAIAAFVAAAARTHDPKGSISLLITGDEEGAAINGTARLLEWLKARGETIDHCVVGEPTSVGHAGDTLKIGRRGSMNFRLVVKGVQGHVGYPQKATNPISAMAELVTQLSSQKLDKGNEHFDPSTLAFTTIDTGNDATNVIPGEARAGFNIRFNDKHTPDSLINWVNDRVARIAQQSGCEITVTGLASGVAFLTAPGKFTQLISDTVAGVTGQSPFFSTSGGTSDARFIKDICPVVELGLAGTTMHKADECVAVSEIAALTDIYAALLAAYFAKPPL
ncbi:MAG TPA: succinyl-diaminopimelate desuccinylase [Rhizomicrobium sp.]|jgi:succinyl-diaminopimelate desuccinylase|nr:succinyl-diaminopimelate desuccinylase [Rhizomicrobium sp.]HWA70045.1 succinyl-diaminopimelate desuccinylase [Rhizomicrobium sp.]